MRTYARSPAPTPPTARRRAATADEGAHPPSPYHGHRLDRVPARDAFARATSGAPSPVPFGAELGRAFGIEVSSVRAFLGRAREMEELGAHAAARGRDVAFSKAQPTRREVAHELAHVAQWSEAADPAPTRAVAGRDDPAEREAHALAEPAAAGHSVTVHAAPRAELHLLTVEERARIEQVLTRVEAAIPNGGLEELTKIDAELTLLLDRTKFDESSEDQALRVRLLKAIDVCSARLSLLKKPVSRKLGGVNASQFAFLAGGPASSSKPMLPKVKSSAPSKRWGNIDFNRVEKEQSPEEFSRGMHKNFQIEADVESRGAASKAARHLGTQPINDDVLAALRPGRVQGSKTLQGLGQPEKVAAANAGFNRADRLVRDVAAHARRTGKAPASAELERIMKSLNVYLTPGSPRPGQYRNEDRGGGLMPFALIEDELPRYCDWLAGALAQVVAKRVNPIEIAAQAYQRLNTIHAFGDGNGRVCQMMMDLVLTCGGLLPSTLEGGLIDPISAEQPPSGGTLAGPSKALATVARGVERSYEIAAGLPRPFADPDIRTETGRAQSMYNSVIRYRGQIEADRASPPHEKMFLKAVLDDFGPTLDRRALELVSLIKRATEFIEQSQSAEMKKEMTERKRDFENALAILRETKRIFDEDLDLYTKINPPQHH